MSGFRNMMLASMRKRRRVPGFVGGWKAYGRSNSEDASTRDILPDYSGNGRDIKLYNFNFTEDSGWNNTDYPGALVSDGIDDYGQCVKDFVLPNDYTICAIRQYVGSPLANASLVGKSKTSGQGAFIFEYNRANTYSYGASSQVTFTDLFTYQSKNSYNGNGINVGSGTDTENGKLTLFATRAGAVYSKVALYDLRIYDHSLTAEELQAVKDEMMADFVKNTGVLDGIDYYDIIDCHGRSNDEREGRDRLVGRLGNLHLNLHNFGYAAGSGWNGYDWDFQSDAYFSKSNVEYTSIKIKVIADASENFFCVNGNATGTEVPSFKVRISGLNDSATLWYGYVAAQGDSGRSLMDLSNGEFTLPPSYLSSYTGSVYVGFAGKNINAGLTIEMLPTNPGSLVFDGVDDYAVTEELLNEPIGALAIMYNHLTLLESGEHYALSSCVAISDADRLTLMYNAAYTWICRADFNAVKDAPLQANIMRTDYAVRTVDHSPTNAVLYIGKAFNYNAMVNMALYQLRLIKNRPTDIQMEVIKWQMDKEHRDWLKKNG